MIADREPKLLKCSICKATNSPREDCPSQRTTVAVAGSAALHPTNTGETEADDAEVVRKAREDGRVEVVFPGPVTQEGCCRFVSEILKCILYQRQQLPMTYDQLVYSQKKQQAAVQVSAVGDVKLPHNNCIQLS